MNLVARIKQPNLFEPIATYISSVNDLLSSSALFKSIALKISKYQSKDIE